MHKKAVFPIALLALVSILSLPVVPMHATSAPEPLTTVATSSPGRSITYRFYDFFDVPQEEIKDVWDGRNKWIYLYEQYWVNNWGYPFIYSIWNVKKNSSVTYSSLRLNINATEIPEINMTTPVQVGPPPPTGVRGEPTYPIYTLGTFLPYNLTGGAQPGITGGTADLSWYCSYYDFERCKYWAPKIPSYNLTAYMDGWQTELNGTITLDKNATMKVLGITSTQYDNIQTWWATNQGTVNTKWLAWVKYLGKWWPSIAPDYSNYIFADYFNVSVTDWTQLPNKITFTFWVVPWGEEVLMARFLHSKLWGDLLPGYEGYYTDLHLTANIGPTYSNAIVDTIVDYSLVCVNTEPYGAPAWVFETSQGDRPSLAHKECFPQAVAWDHIWSPAWPYYQYANLTRKTYYTLSTGQIDYNGYTPYGGVVDRDGYTPDAFNLKSGEKLVFDFSNTIGRPVWGWKQNPWGAGQVPNDTLTKVSGDLTLSYMEPYPADLGTHYNYDQTNKILTITGPFNMTAWSNSTWPKEWARLAGSYLGYQGPLMPWGEPIIDFDIGPAAEFTYAPPAPLVNQTVTFNATASYDQVGTIQNYTWNFGDSTPPVTETTPITTHNYTTAGTYNVTLTVTDNNGLNDTVKHSVKVFAAITHDVAVVSVTPSPTEVTAGDSVSIPVVAANEGTQTETFNVTVYYDNTAIDTKTVTNLAPVAETTLNFTWDTTGVAKGNYTIKAVASTVAGETNTANNVKVDGTVKISAAVVHDVAVVSVTPSPTEVTAGDSVSISVVVKNNGTAAETFNVATYYDTTAIDTKTVTSLASGATNTLTFTWDTTGVAKGNYTIKAVASTVAGETNTANNVKVDGTVKVKAPPPSAFPTTLVVAIIVIVIVVAAAALLYIRRKPPRA